MKYCPNIGCPFLLENNAVAEYEDEIEVCSDCGMALEPGAAPKMRLPDPQFEPAVRNELLATLCSVETEEDAEYFKEKLEFQGIPVKIVKTVGVDEEDPEGGEVEVYDLRVLNSYLANASRVLDLILELEGEEDEEGAES